MGSKHKKGRKNINVYKEELYTILPTDGFLTRISKSNKNDIIIHGKLLGTLISFAIIFLLPFDYFVYLYLKDEESE